MTYGYTNITNLYQSHYKITNFIHDFGPQNETPRNHRIGLSARAVDPDLINRWEIMEKVGNPSIQGYI